MSLIVPKPCPEELMSLPQQQLKVIKANNHATARSQWYDWRLQWVEQLYAIANQGFCELEQVRPSPVMRLFALSDVAKGCQYLRDYNPTS